MKKIVKHVSAILLSACLLLFSACSSAPAGSENSKEESSSTAEQSSVSESEESSEPEESETVSYDGIWETAKVEIDGEEYSSDQIEENGISTTLTLYPDGSFTLQNDNVEREGTWSEKDGKIEMTTDGYTPETELVNDQLVIISEENGSTVRMFFDRKGDAQQKEDPENTKSDRIVGIWKLDSIELDEDMFTPEEIEEAKTSMEKNAYQFDIREDGTFRAFLVDGEDTVDAVSGEWHQSGDDYILESDGEPITFHLSGDSLLAEDNSTTLIFKKK